MDETDVILLVEDNPDDVALIRRAFRRAGLGASIRLVADGELAVAYLAGEAPYAEPGEHPLPAVILLDLMLPRRSGFEVLEWLRAQPGLRRIPVVVLTSSEQAVDLDRAYDLGANSYLVKPVMVDALTALVRNVDQYWLGLNRRARPQRSASTAS